LQSFKLSGASVIANENPTPDDEGMHVHGSEPHSGSIFSGSMANQQTANEIADEESETKRSFVMVILILFVFAALAAGAIYWWQMSSFPSVVAITSPDKPKRPDPLGDRGALVPISPDLLHVTSIALGNPRLTIVNGKRLAEEDWLIVKTPNGDTSVRVVSIQDGHVQFKHGKDTLDARLQMPQGQTPRPH
jgi:hypothetical protein